MSSFEGRREYTREHNRLLNDALRRWSVGGDIFVTQTVRELPINEQSAALEKLSEFNNFNECNDPTGEHDFGIFESHKNTLFSRSHTRKIGTAMWFAHLFSCFRANGSRDNGDRHIYIRKLVA